MAKELAFFEHINGKAFAKDMKELGDSMKDMTVANKKIAIQTFAWVTRNFQGQGKNVGGWKPLEASTIASRRTGDRKGSPKILQDTGALKNEWKLTWTRFRMAIQSQNEYSAFHDQQPQYGGKPNELPQRRILPTQDEAGEWIQKIYDLEYGRKMQRGVNKLARLKGVKKL